MANPPRYVVRPLIHPRTHIKSYGVWVPELEAWVSYTIFNKQQDAIRHTKRLNDGGSPRGLFRFKEDGTITLIKIPSSLLERG